MSDATVATTILAQLGGIGRIRMMTGADQFVYDDTSIKFRIGGGAKNRIRYVKITLNGNDLYDVEFAKVVKYEYKIVAAEQDIYVDMLMKLIEDTTGFYLSL